VVASSSRLKPGEKGKISVKVNIQGRAGHLSKSVQVFSNDPKKKIVTLIVKANIEVK
jgi:hypothetical protein